jgi:hypothetical protein
MPNHKSLLWLTLALALFAVAGCGGDDDPVTPTPSSLTFKGGVLPMAIAQHSYSWTVSASGGKKNYEFDLDHDLLPPGIVAESVDNDLVFHGNATQAGSFSIPVTVIDADKKEVSATFTINVGADSNIADVWSVTVTVTVATGDCAGETGPSPAVPITITQTGSTLSAKGWLGLDSNVLTGSTGGDNGNVVTLSGTIPEEGGNTTITHIWTLTSPNSMSGTEDWSWTDGVDSCPNSKSTVVCTR